jgi:plastocyanin
MTWHRAVWVGFVVGGPSILAYHRTRTGEVVPPGAAAPVPAAAAVAVSGTVTVLGAGTRVRDAVVYLEPLDEARPVAAPRPAPRAVPTAATVGPRDSTRLLWGAVRELAAVTRDLRARLGGAGAPARPPATPTLAVIDSAAAGLSAAPAAPVAEPAPDPAAAARLAAARAASATRAEILMRQKTFLPHVRVVPAGGAVDWPNRDPFSHNVFSNTPGGAFDLGLYPRGESRGAAFRRPGVYAVFCNIHPRMSAYVVSVPAPYYAQPGPDGRWTIADVPPGRYRLRVWHEQAREQAARPITVSASGAAPVAVTLDAREYRAQPHANKFGQPYARAARDEY